jgi:hypothetical protein
MELYVLRISLKCFKNYFFFYVQWTVGTCTVWVVLAKIGTEVDFLTLLFVISNFAFVIFPLIEYFPHLDSSKVIETDGQSFHERNWTLL